MVPDLDPLNLTLSIIFGCIGFAYTIYGRKNNFYFLLAGLCLMVFTFFDLDTLTLSLLGVGLVIAPFIISKLDL